MKFHEKITPLAIGLAVIVSLLLAIRFGLNTAANTQNIFKSADDTDVVTQAPTDSTPTDQSIDTQPSTDESTDSSTETPTPPDASPDNAPPVETPEAPASPAEETPPPPEEVPVAPEVQPEEPPAEPTPEPLPEETAPTEPMVAPTDEHPDAPTILPAFANTRSLLEGVVSEIDWLYTLRSGADFDGIAATREELKTKLLALADILEEPNGGDATAAQQLLCGSSSKLQLLTIEFAAGTDTTQPKLDQENTDVLNDVGAAINTVTAAWQLQTGLSAACR